MAIEAIFSEIVRERFRLPIIPGAGLPWVYDSNYTPGYDETNEVDNARKVVIEPAFNVNNEVRNMKPAIFIEALDLTPQKVVLNNMVAARIQNNLEAFSCMASCPLIIECKSDTRAESAQMADIVWFYLLSGRNVIRETFGFHDIDGFSLGRTIANTEDKTAWSTIISSNLQLQFKWLTQPIAPKLQDIVFRLKNNNNNVLITQKLR